MIYTNGDYSSFLLPNMSAKVKKIKFSFPAINIVVPSRIQTRVQAGLLSLKIANHSATTAGFFTLSQDKKLLVEQPVCKGL